MTLSTLLIPFEVITLTLLLVYLVHIEMKARFLRRQEKRRQAAQRLPRLAKPVG